MCVHAAEDATAESEAFVAVSVAVAGDAAVGDLESVHGVGGILIERSRGAIEGAEAAVAGSFWPCI